ncbi:rRNA biogenesis protein RRP5 [Linum grandiflorum]
MAAPSSKKRTQNRNPKEAPKFNKDSKKPFKAKKKDSSDVVAKKTESASMSLQLEDDVPDFPRGGGSSLSQKERDDIRSEVDAEFEAGEMGVKKNKKGKKLRKKQVDPDDFGSLFGDGLTGKLPKFANKITTKNISPGMKLWGVVAEVNEKDLVISLPGGLRGLVRNTDAVDSIWDDETKENEGYRLNTFHVGQLVSCIVLQLDDDKKGKRKIWLSLCLSLLHKGFSLDMIQEGMVLTAYVKSIEDHGYILHFGVPSFTGFLPKSSQSVVKPGQLLKGVITKIDKNRKVVFLSADKDMVSKYVMSDVKGMSIDLLIPGMMVNARVQTTLENGVMLSFLTYFTGTVDMFHLQSSFPATNWKDDYSKNKKVNARILFIDPSTRAVGLTLNRHLVQNISPPTLVKVGDICDNAKVVWVDKNMGLLLEIPSIPVSIPAFVSIPDVAEAEVPKLEKKFKERSIVRVRIIGFRHLEGLATGTLKESAIEGPGFTHSEVQPGMVVRGKIIAVDSFGAIVQFPGGLKALCPLQHMSEFEIAKPRKKFQVKSKLPIISSYAEATDGLVVHGWITKIEKHGCFVHFYNGVQGFAPRLVVYLNSSSFSSRSELGLEPGSEPNSMYHLGQVMKCRVTSSVPSSRRINLSFMMKATRLSEEDSLKLGNVVTGVVEKVTPSVVVVNINGKQYLKGTIATEHMADHHGLAVSLKSVLKPGHEFDKLLVLDIEGNNVILSAKYSLINSAQELPSDISQIRPHSIVHGYICNIIETGCFVRFLDRLTGFSPRSKSMDDSSVQLSEAFHIGQSVRSNIVEVNSETNRITLSLKQSICASADASFLQGYFLSDDKIAKFQSTDAEGPGFQWVEEFGVGSIIEGKIQESKEFGVVVSFDKYKNVLGFITNYQLGGTTVGTGSIIQAAILDVARSERLVDLTLKPELLNKFRDQSSSKKSQKKKRKSEVLKDLEVNQKVNAVVEIVKENYMASVLSLPEYNYAVGYASLSDYNSQRLPHRQIMNGQSITATIVALPSSSTTGRLLLMLNSTGQVTDTSNSKKAKKKGSVSVGSLVQVEVTEKKQLEMRVKFGAGLRGRIHATEVTNAGVSEDPFSEFRIGQTLTARIVAKSGQSNNKNGLLWELSVKAEVLADLTEGSDNISENLEFSSGQCVSGYVYKVDSEWVWAAVSRSVNAQLFILDSSSEPSELEEFQNRFSVGKLVRGYVLTYNKAKKLLRVGMHPLRPLKQIDNVAPHIHEGDVVGGRISKVLPGVGGLFVQIGPHLHGKVHFTELKDSWTADPLAEYHEGQFVRCKVLEIGLSIKGTAHIDLSLRSSFDGMCSQRSVESSGNSRHVEKIEDLHPNDVVQGYVKSITAKGCFILLSRKLEAKILVSNLSDGYIEKPETEFPVGKLVVGRVLSVEPLSKRIEVTLRTTNPSKDSKSQGKDLSHLRVGRIVSGSIRRVEPYGLFVTLSNSNMVGLCHISELPADQANDTLSNFKAGEKVTVKILQVDEERRRISLGMTDLDMENNDDESDEGEEEDGEEEDGEEEDGDSDDDTDTNITLLPERDDSESEDEGEESPILAEAESRASIPPLEVTLDDMDEDQADDRVASDNQGHNVEPVTKDKKKNEKSKSREEREKEIAAAEERLLENDVPQTADEFEKLVRGSPNSSFIWIKYMAFLLNTSDVEKARSVAERALRTISFREEGEKLNIWVAYFNLENEYGVPREEAVNKLFNRALQFCDSKKVHMALLGMYERTKQDKPADELVNKMVRKFKQSCKVWLARMRMVISHEEDKVQSVVQRALMSLPRRKHIKFITQAALLEFKSGLPDRGRNMFEGVLREYPKRTDLWSIYIDQEIKHGDADMTRSLFERAITLSLAPKKMTFLFKKYLEYEKSVGDAEKIEAVKQKALDYARSELV